MSRAVRRARSRAGVPADQTAPATRPPADSGRTARPPGRTSRGRAPGPFRRARSRRGPLAQRRRGWASSRTGASGPPRCATQAPQFGPDSGRAGFFEDGDDEPLALQLGQRDPVGRQRLCAGRRQAWLTCGPSGHGEARREALDAGHVVDARSAAGRRSPTCPTEAGRAAVAAGQESGRAGRSHFRGPRAAGPELQLAVADRHVVAFDDRHQRGQVLRDVSPSRVSTLPVEVVRAQAEEFEYVVGRPRPAPVSWPGERAAAVPRPPRPPPGSEGDRPAIMRALAVLVCEAGRALAHRKQTAAAPSPCTGQGRPGKSRTASAASRTRRPAPRGEHTARRPAGVGGR